MTDELEHLKKIHLSKSKLRQRGTFALQPVFRLQVTQLFGF